MVTGQSAASLPGLSWSRAARVCQGQGACAGKPHLETAAAGDVGDRHASQMCSHDPPGDGQAQPGAVTAVGAAGAAALEADIEEPGQVFLRDAAAHQSGAGPGFCNCGRR